MIVGVENPLSDTVGYEYDGVGNLLTQTASNGGGDPQVTTYHYDGANRRDTETYPDDEAGVNVRSFSYNGAGQVQTRTDQNGDVTTYTYDDLHRLTQRSYTINSGVTYPAAQPPDTFSYDLAGRMLTAVKDANTTVLTAADVDTFTYNAGGAVTHFSQGGLTIDYAYVVDANTSRRTITYNGGMVIQENADKRGRIETIIDVSTNTPVTLAVNMYDQSDHLLGRDFGNATEAVWTYDAAGRVNHILHEVTGGSPLVEFNYVRDAVGNPTCRENLLTSNMSEHYTYDDADRLTLFQRGDVSTHGAGCSFGSATSNTGVLQEQAWTLDSLGNWSTNGTTVNSSSAAETRSHNKANEITDITTDGTTYPTYDDNGNITNDGTFIYSYDAENRLTRVQNQSYDTISESYYDALGRRVRKVVTNSDNDGDYRYLWNQDWQLMNVFVFADSELKPRQRLVHAGSPTAWYKSPSPLKGEGWGEGVGGGRAYIDDHVCIYIPGGMGGGRKYFHTDAQYNTQMVTDASSNIAASYVLSAYGLVETITQPGMGGLGSYATNNAMIHQGLIYDAETGSYYNRNRILKPEIGRFLQRDPLGYADGVNLYGYVNANPLVEHDPNGTFIPWGMYEYAKRVKAEKIAKEKEREFRDRWGERDSSHGNCYRFACNDPIEPGEPDHQAVPGDHFDPNNPCDSVVGGAIQDGLTRSGSDGNCPSGTTPVVVVVGQDPNGNADFHWYRRDDSGIWYHKPGYTPVTGRDADGHWITDPRNANRDYSGNGGVNYNQVCATLCAPGGMHVD